MEKEGTDPIQVTGILQRSAISSRCMRVHRSMHRPLIPSIFRAEDKIGTESNPRRGEQPPFSFLFKIARLEDLENKKEKIYLSYIYTYRREGIKQDQDERIPFRIRFRGLAVASRLSRAPNYFNDQCPEWKVNFAL